MTTDDMPLVQCWLAMPHVAEWWHDRDEFAFVSGDLGHHDLAQFIVSIDGRPLGYLQCYRIGDWHAGYGRQPVGTRGLDQFIGDADMLGHGHGPAFIRSFAADLIDGGTPRIVVDPRPTNARAIRCYEKAGFVRDREVDTPDGIALLMVRNA